MFPIEEPACRLKYKLGKGQEAEHEWVRLGELSHQELQYEPQGTEPAQPGPSSSLQPAQRKATVRSTYFMIAALC